MSNFFYDPSEYSLFKKAMKTTSGEPIIINLLSTDSSLIDEEQKDKPAPVVHKNFSSKFEASPFGKYFGPRRQRTTPVDMSDFSSWKNKNYRQTEKNLSEQQTQEKKFSLADYMNKMSAGKKFNEVDQMANESQKPIDQLSADDPTYQKFSLDSFLHKFEQQKKVEDEFAKNNDLLQPFDDNMQNIVPDSSQDENFLSESDVNVEQFTADTHLGGEHFAFDPSELDKVRARMDKIERETNNIKDKVTQKVINTNELTEIAKDGEEDDFDLGKLGFKDDIPIDDIEKINERFTGGANANSEVPQVSHKTYIQINKTPETAINRTTVKTTETTDAESDNGTITDVQKLTATETDAPVEDADELDDDSLIREILGLDSQPTEKEDGEDEIVDESEELDVEEETDEDLPEEFVGKTRITRDDILTKDDLREITDDFMTKFAEMHKVNEPTEEGVYAEDPAYQSSQVGMSNAELMQQQAELQARILEMIEANKKNDSEAEERLKQAELEKLRIAEEYESRLKELEETIKAREEESKRQAYLDKLKHDIKLQKAETNFRKREERLRELERESSENMKIGVRLKEELRSNLNIANLEMDKKLLEIASKIRREEEYEARVVEPQPEYEDEEAIEEEVEEVVRKPRKKPTQRRTPTSGARKKTSMRSHSHTRTPRRKIDSDIIGGINFD